MKTVHVSGSRKNAVARATVSAGSGVVRVNSRLISTLPLDMYRSKMEEALLLAGDVAKKVDISVRVSGGGPNGQAEAVRLAISKALCKVDKKLQSVYLDYDRAFIVADVRLKETHKPNCHGKARAGRQTSYR